MAHICTYVFLDLEATGIPKEEGNKTRITEISLIAIKRQHLLECKPGEEPRVQQKMTLCLNPLRLVHPEVTSLTGLCNFALEHEPTFNKELCSTLQSFLSLLTKPICLIAQNGFKFDFPLLKNHLESLNLNFDEDLLCADSLYAFYDILEKPNLASCSSEQDFKNGGIELSMQELNEITPKKQIIKSSTSIKNLKCKPHSKAKRKLFWENNERPKHRFDLKGIYERLLNEKPKESHRAEADCVMVIKCAAVVSEQFTSWVEDNHCLFREVKPMTIGVPIGQ